ncbi:MAG: winged helix-turn-helix transcriptional regulator [Gammaproteobacteria bacterium]
MRYKQFCPVAKASELLGEKWTILIIREALMGATRFNEFQRGLPLISPTMLTKRLHELAKNGLLTRKRIPAQKGYKYYLTEAGKELFPVIKQLGDWGMRWARGQMEDSDLDVELLMLYLGRSIKPEKLPGEETIIQFNFSDLEKLGKWWIVVRNNDVDVCLEDPGKDVDVWFVTDLRTMIEVWMGDITYRQAIREKRLKLIGSPSLTSNVTRWMADSVYSGIPPAKEIE